MELAARTQVNIQGTDETSAVSHTTTTQQVAEAKPTTNASVTATPTFARLQCS
ncbi:hypothetical protein P4S64_21055 [Vibrio sp. M60_M31a]